MASKNIKTDYIIDGIIQGTQIKSTITTGTAPFTVVSTTLVSNLNSDLLDGNEGSYFLDYNNFTNKPSFVSKSGAPVFGQIAVWTSDGVIQGLDNFTQSGAEMKIGQEDFVRGFVTIYGDGGTNGGELDLQNGAGGDTDDAWYALYGGPGVFTIEGFNTGAFFTYSSSTETIGLPKYGTGAITGTSAYNLAVDSNGKIIEVATTGGGGDFLPLSGGTVTGGEGALTIVAETDGVNGLVMKFPSGAFNDSANILFKGNDGTFNINYASIKGGVESWSSDHGYLGFKTANATVLSEKMRLTAYGTLEVGTGVTGTAGTLANSLKVEGTISGSNLSGSNTGDQSTITGNAGSATILQTARTIAGVSFNGSANISLNNNAITNGAGYTSNAGTVTSVTGGVGVDSTGGATPSITLDVNELAVGGTLVGTDHIIAANGTVSNKQLISAIPLSIFNNNLGWTSNSGDITSVSITTANGLSGGGTDTSGSVAFTLNLSTLTANWNGGSTYTITANDFILGSDRKLKTAIVPMNIKPLKVEYVEYEYKTNLGEKRFGVIAQDLEVNHPELIRTDEDGLKSVSYNDLLVREVASLKQELAEIKEMLKNLNK